MPLKFTNEMNLFCIGLSHHTAAVETRERFAGRSEAGSILRGSGCAEALLLTTCNRVEVYAAAEKYIPTEKIAACLARSIEQMPNDDLSAFYRYEQLDCVQHLFRVTSGIDSMVVGETEILGQVKRAYEAAHASGSAGVYLHRLFQRAFRVAKQVRTRTDITRGSVSVGSVAVDLAGKIFGDLGTCKVLVVGAGDTGERTARSLVSRGVRDLRVSNRSLDRAQQLAQAVNGVVIPFEQWPEQCREIDILITSTSAGSTLLNCQSLEPMLRERTDRPLFIIDLAVPRDVDPAINKMEGVYLYDIDSLQAVAEQSLAQRREQIAAAEAIIAEHLSDFSSALSRLMTQKSAGAADPAFGGTLRSSQL